VFIIGQDEVLDFFRKQYLSGNKSFMCVNDVIKQFPNVNARGVRCSILKLYAWGYLDIYLKDRWKRHYKIKEEYLGSLKKPHSPFGNHEGER